MSQLIILQITPEELRQLIEQAIASALSPVHVQPSPEEYLKRNDIARMFKVSLTTINEWSRTGKLNRHRIGSRVYYLRSEVETLFVKTNFQLGQTKTGSR